MVTSEHVVLCVPRWVVLAVTWTLYLLRRLFMLGVPPQAAVVVPISPVDGPTPGGDEAFVKQLDCWHIYCFYSKHTIRLLQYRVERLCCSEAENKEILKMCNQDCFSIRSLGTTTIFSWRRGFNAVTRIFENVWVHRLAENFREQLDMAALLILGNNPLKSSDHECRVTLKMSENPCLDVLAFCISH